MSVKLIDSILKKNLTTWVSVTIWVVTITSGDSS